MSEARITEAELRAFEGAVNLLAAYTDYEDAQAIHMSVRIVAEVRRLRALIVEATADPMRNDQTGKPQGPLYDALMRHKAAWRALEAEASAIREGTVPKTVPTQERST